MWLQKKVLHSGFCTLFSGVFVQDSSETDLTNPRIGSCRSALLIDTATPQPLNQWFLDFLQLVTTFLRRSPSSSALHFAAPTNSSSAVSCSWAFFSRHLVRSAWWAVILWPWLFQAVTRGTTTPLHMPALSTSSLCHSWEQHLRGRTYWLPSTEILRDAWRCRFSVLSSAVRRRDFPGTAQWREQ